MHTVTFLRHAESEGNAQQLLQGQTDASLSAQGMADARKLAVRWKSLNVAFDLIICSPLLRARQTAEAVGTALDASIEIEPIWIERSFGQLEGQSYAQIEQMEPKVDYYAPYDPVGGDGESQVELYLRASQGIQSLLRRPPGRYLVISHGAILNKVLYAILGITPQGHYNSPAFRMGNLSYVQLAYEPSRRQWNVMCFSSPELWEGKLPELRKGP